MTEFLRTPVSSYFTTLLPPSWVGGAETMGPPSPEGGVEDTGDLEVDVPVTVPPGPPSPETIAMYAEEPEETAEDTEETAEETDEETAAEPAEKVPSIDEAADEAMNDKWSGSFGEPDVLRDREARKDAIRALPENQRAAAVAKTEDPELNEELLAEVERQEASDKKRAAEVKAKVEATAASTEAAVKAGDKAGINTAIDNVSLSQRKKLLATLSPDAKAAAEEQIALRRARLEEKAKAIAKAADGMGTDSPVIVAELTGLSKSEGEELEEIYDEMTTTSLTGAKSHRHMRSDLKGEFGDDESKEKSLVDAALDGDTEKAKELSVDLTTEYVANETNALFYTDDKVVNTVMRPHGDDPASMAKIDSGFKERTGQDLGTELEKKLDDGPSKVEALAYVRNDMDTADAAVIAQDDPSRKKVVIAKNVEDGTVAKLSENSQNLTGVRLTDQIKDIPSAELGDVEAKLKNEETMRAVKLDGERHAALDALKEKTKGDPAAFAKIDQDAQKIAETLATKLGKKLTVGNRNDVTDPLVGLDPAQLQLVMDHYAKLQESAGKEGASLEVDLRGKLGGKDLKVANAVLTHNTALAKVAAFEQAADGAGTQADAMKKTLESCKTEQEVNDFTALMDKQVGGVKGSALKRVIKDETGSYDRDELQALSIANENQRAGQLAGVRMMKHAYGGQITQLVEEMGDAYQGADESEAARSKRRQEGRNTLLSQVSNLGGSAEGMLDAAQQVDGVKQIDALETYLASQGTSGREISEGETSGHQKKALDSFLANDYEGGQAQRTMASKGEWYDPSVDETGMSKQFKDENLRFTPDQKERLAKFKDDPTQLAIEMEKEKQISRASLKARVDVEAVVAGEGSLDEMQQKHLSTAEYNVAAEETKAGKASEITRLIKAGDTTIGNLGKDSAVFYEVLDKSPADVQKLREQFPGGPEEFDKFVMSKAGSAGEKRDFKILLEGNYAKMKPDELRAMATDHPEKLIQRVKDLEQAARGGVEEGPDPLVNAILEHGNQIGNDLGDAMGDSGTRMTKRLTDAKAIEAKLAKGEPMSDKDIETLMTHATYMSGDQKGFTETKSDAVDTVGKVGGKLANVVTTGATGSTVAGDAAEGTVELMTKAVLDPSRTSADFVVEKAIQIGGNAALGHFGGKMPKGGWALESIGGGVVDALSQTKKWNDLDTLAVDALAGGGKGLVTGGAGQLIDRLVPEGMVKTLLSAGSDAVVMGDPNRSGFELLQEIAVSAGTSHAQGKAKAHHDAANAPSHEKSEVDPEHGKKVENEANFSDVDREVALDKPAPQDAKAPLTDEATRRARNEALHDINDSTPGPVAKATSDMKAALNAGDGTAAVAALANITDLSQRKALLHELRADAKGAPIDTLLAKLPESERAEVQRTLDSVKANPEHVKLAADQLAAQETARGEVERLKQTGASQADIEAAQTKLLRARQNALDAISDAYGIDDSVVVQRGPTDRMGYGMERGDIAPSRKPGDSMGEALPGGNVVMRNGGESMFVDANGKPRSQAFIAAALGHEVEVHIAQLREGRYTEPLKGLKPGQVDVGTAINEAEAYAYMVREADRFGLKGADLEFAQKRYDEQLKQLEKADPAAHQRVIDGDFSVPGHDVVDAPHAPWTPHAEPAAPDGGEQGKQIAKDEEPLTDFDPLDLVGPFKSDVDPKGRPTMRAQTEHGEVTAKRVGDRMVLKFPDGMPLHERQELANNAQYRLDVRPIPGDYDLSGDTAEIPYKLGEISGDMAAPYARQIAEGLQRQNPARYASPDEQSSECLKLSAQFQAKLAEKGVFVPVIHNSVEGQGDHNYLQADNQIIDPSFGQFLPHGLQPTKENPNPYGPFIGTPADLLNRLKETGAHGETDPETFMRLQWGLVRDPDGGPEAFKRMPTAIESNRDEVIKRPAAESTTPAEVHDSSVYPVGKPDKSQLIEGPLDAVYPLGKPQVEVPLATKVWNWFKSAEAPTAELLKQSGEDKGNVTAETLAPFKSSVGSLKLLHQVFTEGLGSVSREEIGNQVLRSGDLLTVVLKGAGVIDGNQADLIKGILDTVEATPGASEAMGDLIQSVAAGDRKAVESIARRMLSVSGSSRQTAEEREANEEKIQKLTVALGGKSAEQLAEEQAEADH